MTITTRTLYTVVCESCPAEYEAADADSAMAARVAAGVAGWKYRTTSPQKFGRRSYDYCPNCEVPK